MGFYSFGEGDIERALEMRASLVEAKSFSRPQSERKVAVALTYVYNHSYVAPEEKTPLVVEAEAITNELKRRGESVDLLDNITSDELKSVILDPTVTDLVLIGEGGLGNLIVREDADYFSTVGFDWRDVSDTADHLKTGRVYQRMCSVVNDLNVPWGLPLVSDARNVWISEVDFFVPEEVHHDPATDLMPVFDTETVNLNTIRCVVEVLKGR